jgi:hypothetical protein
MDSVLQVEALFVCFLQLSDILFFVFLKKRKVLQISLGLPE